MATNEIPESQIYTWNGFGARACTPAEGATIPDFEGAPEGTLVWKGRDLSSQDFSTRRKVGHDMGEIVAAADVYCGYHATTDPTDPERVGFTVRAVREGLEGIAQGDEISIPNRFHEVGYLAMQLEEKIGKTGLNIIVT